MSRGNHESENMNKMYGFEGEVKAKYSANMVDLFTGLLKIPILFRASGPYYVFQNLLGTLAKSYFLQN